MFGAFLKKKIVLLLILIKNVISITFRIFDKLFVYLKKILYL